MYMCIYIYIYIYIYALANLRHRESAGLGTCLLERWPRLVSPSLLFISVVTY